MLLRLWRFCRPYRSQLFLGFALMLGSTGATLVAPYLTMPLMDKVLIPFQNGQAIDPSLVAWLLSGLFGAALVSWALGWGKTYLLALVSERIAADLRTTTFEHLLGLSLEYFGTKRTGDLMARIGSETDRISVFLSLHALDFITDVLMLTMTSIILFNIHPGLALATLLPLPLIAWLIHQVRDRLRTGFEDRPRLGRGHQHPGRHHPRHPVSSRPLRRSRARRGASRTPTPRTCRSMTGSTVPGACSRPPSRC